MIALLLCGVEAGPLLAEESDPADRLSGTAWNVTLRPVDASRDAPVQQDTISFDGRRMRSDALTQQGYPSSNCTIRLQADGAVTWETMQTKSGEGVVFWRGELRDNQMSGVLTRQPDTGSPQHFSFTGLNAPNVPVTPPAAPPQAASLKEKPVKAPAPPPLPAASAQPPKKKRWLW